MSWIIELRRTLSEHGLEFFNKYYGVYRGFVVDNNDPDNLGRVTLKVPTIWGLKSYDYWAWSRGQYAYVIPEVGDMVWVSFENGNSKYPIWEYAHWNNERKIPEVAKTIKQKVFQVPNGMRIVFDEESNFIQVFHSDKRVFEINEEGISLGSTKASKFHALLGEETEECMEKLREDLSGLIKALNTYSTAQVTATASSGILAPLSAGYTSLITELIPTIASLEVLKEKIKGIKSSIITLDK
jgi:hypothetical protein